MNKITFRFHGNLRKYGTDLTLYAESINDGMRSLCLQIDGLKKHMKHKYYQMRVGRRNISEDEYKNGIKTNKDCIVNVYPRVIGAGPLALVAGAILTGAGLMGVGGTVIAGIMLQMGIGLMLSGAAALLTKQPKANTNQEGVEDPTSSAFTNLSNMVGQGKQVPKIYGVIMVGSIVISQGVMSFRGDSSDSANGVQNGNHIISQLGPITLKDKNNTAYNIDTSSDSVKNAAVNVNVNWS